MLPQIIKDKIITKYIFIMLGSNILSLKSMLPSALNTQLAAKATFVGIDFGTSTTVVSIATKENDEEKIG